MAITALYAALLTALYLAMSVRIIAARRAGSVDLGDNGHPLLRRLVRGHGNFAEYAPFGLVLLGLLELGGWPVPLLHGLGGLLVAGRALHAWAFSATAPRPVARVAGTAMTLTMIGLSGLLAFAQAVGQSRG